MMSRPHLTTNEDLDLRRVEEELRELERQEKELTRSSSHNHARSGKNNETNAMSRRLLLEELKRVWKASLALEDELLKFYIEVEYNAKKKELEDVKRAIVKRKKEMEERRTEEKEQLLLEGRTLKYMYEKELEYGRDPGTNASLEHRKKVLAQQMKEAQQRRQQEDEEERLRAPEELRKIQILETDVEQRKKSLMERRQNIIFTRQRDAQELQSLESQGTIEQITWHLEQKKQLVEQRQLALEENRKMMAYLRAKEDEEAAKALEAKNRRLENTSKALQFRKKSIKDIRELVKKEDTEREESEIERRMSELESRKAKLEAEKRALEEKKTKELEAQQAREQQAREEAKKTPMIKSASELPKQSKLMPPSKALPNGPANQRLSQPPLPVPTKILRSPSEPDAKGGQLPPHRRSTPPPVSNEMIANGNTPTDLTSRAKQQQQQRQMLRRNGQSVQEGLTAQEVKEPSKIELQALNSRKLSLIAETRINVKREQEEIERCRIQLAERKRKLGKRREELEWKRKADEMDDERWKQAQRDKFKEELEYNRRRAEAAEAERLRNAKKQIFKIKSGK